MSAVLTRYETTWPNVEAVAQAHIGEGPLWLRNLRSRGLRVFQELGIPTPKVEEWKYTPLRDIAERKWELAEPGPAWFEPALPSFVEGAVRIVLVNGRFDANLSDFPRLPGLTVSPIREALTDDANPVSAVLGTIARIEKHPFGALATALFEDGVYVHLATGSVIESLIEIVHVTSGEGGVCAPRVLIVAEKDSVAKIVEVYVTDGAADSLTLPVTEVIVERGANLEHVRVQDEATTNAHIALWETRQAEGSEYRSYNVAFGGRLARTDQGIDLQGEHCITRLDGVVAATGNQLIDNHTRLDHALPNCNSFEIYKQVIDDEATVVFNGQIFVHAHAQKTDAKQTNQALLMSPKATINSKPQLEIFADDVKCTHGATVGQLEDLPLFYMRQRGIPQEMAESLLVYAFAAEVLELISVDEVKRDLEARLDRKLGTEPLR
ncbi:MAG: Fe-S cluster assembly protein SufD [Fimbriimonadaceae bacterium]|nr:Fe-S cluster assembly protein SufD [Fimbriimonadaceae bacterium]